MILSATSKSGKSFSLIELAFSIAEGMNWLGHKCEQGKVLYINMSKYVLKHCPFCGSKEVDYYSYFQPHYYEDMNKWIAHAWCWKCDAKISRIGDTEKESLDATIEACILVSVRPCPFIIS